MQLDLRVQRMGEQALVGAVDGHTGLVEGRFNPQNAHGVSSSIHDRFLDPIRLAGFSSRQPQQRVSHKGASHCPNRGFTLHYPVPVTPHLKVRIRMPNVKVKENEPFDVAMRRFKRSCEKAGVLTEVRRREYYEKPTSVRKRKAAAAVKRHLKKLARENARRTQRRY